MGQPGYPVEVQKRFWRARSLGLGDEAAAVAVGVSMGTAKRWIMKCGGVKPDTSQSSGRYLSFDDRIEIYIGIKGGDSDAVIGARIGVNRCTVWREWNRNTTIGAGRKVRRANYLPRPAQACADRSARRPKPRKLDGDLALHGLVQHWLDRKFSPRQITYRLKYLFGNDERMSISHETLYQCIYVNSAGGLRRELTASLRTGRTLRKPGRKTTEQRGKIPDMVSIVERPEEALGRAVPGHWEGDLIIGAHNKSAIGTLVDRCTRTTMLLHLPDGHRADQVRDAMIKAAARMPLALRKTLTWDQGSEMSRHGEISTATDIDIYFCNPHSPWQRPTNENTNGLLRQYFAKGTDLSVHPEAYLLEVEEELNSRPREVLHWRTPEEALEQVLLQDQLKDSVATTP